MNIQQLNRSGQSLWVFLCTAGVALLLTGMLWYCAEEISKYRAWTQQLIDCKRERLISAQGLAPEIQKHGILVRFSLLLWLVRRGQWPWSWRSGAWFHILINSERLPEIEENLGIGLRRQFPNEWPLWQVPAGQYVSKAMRDDCIDYTPWKAAIYWPVPTLRGNRSRTKSSSGQATDGA